MDMATANVFRIGGLGFYEDEHTLAYSLSVAFEKDI